jgi:hypothetical protein
VSATALQPCLSLLPSLAHWCVHRTLNLRRHCWLLWCRPKRTCTASIC